MLNSAVLLSISTGVSRYHCYGRGLVGMEQVCPIYDARLFSCSRGFGVLSVRRCLKSVTLLNYVSPLVRTYFHLYSFEIYAKNDKNK